MPALPPAPPASPEAAAAQESFHRAIVDEVATALGRHDVVVVGMGWNPVVKKAKANLTQAGVQFHAIDYGNYTSMWKERLALKLWANWPTFPQVYVKGTLIGGNSELEKALADGSFKQRLGHAG